MSCTLTQALQDWTVDQRKRRRALSPATIASYSDAWHAFMQWAAANDRHSTQSLQARDFAAWINTLGHLADGSVQTYSHGTIAICKYLADRGLLGCEISLIQMHIGDALPRIVPSRAPDVADLRRLVSFYDTSLAAGTPHSKPERDRLSALRNNALLHLLFSSACRISEVLAIDIADIRGDHGAVAARVSVVGKGNKRRTVFVRPHARTAIEAYLLARRASFPSATALFISHGPRSPGHRLNRIAAWNVVTHAALTLGDTVERDGRPTKPHSCARPPHTPSAILLRCGSSTKVCSCQRCRRSSAMPTHASPSSIMRGTPTNVWPKCTTNSPQIRCLAAHPDARCRVHRDAIPTLAIHPSPP